MSEAEDEIMPLPSSKARATNKVQGNPRLSVISGKYDVGNKGFLTDAEKQMREMDTGNIGYLTNEQVAKIVGDAIAMNQANRQLKLWLTILGVAVLVLAVSNVGTAYAAALLAKDTSVDPDGVLKVKGSDKPVTTVGTGSALHFTPDQGQEQQGVLASACLPVAEAARPFNLTGEGVSTSVVTHAINGDVEEEHILTYSRDGMMLNETHACIPVSGGVYMQCFDFTDARCDPPAEERRRLWGDDRAVEVTHHDRRRLFQAHAKGLDHRQLQTFVHDLTALHSQIASFFKTVGLGIKRIATTAGQYIEIFFLGVKYEYWFACLIFGICWDPDQDRFCIRAFEHLIGCPTIDEICEELEPLCFWT